MQRMRSCSKNCFSGKLADCHVPKSRANRQVSAEAIGFNFSSNCACVAFNWVFLSILSMKAESLKFLVQMSSILRNVRTIQIYHEKSLMKDLARFTSTPVDHVTFVIKRFVAFLAFSSPEPPLSFSWRGLDSS